MEERKIVLHIFNFGTECNRIVTFTLRLLYTEEGTTDWLSSGAGFGGPIRNQ
jgi:hypothetical protein